VTPIQINYDIYRSACTPLVGTADGAVCQWPGTACTASTFKLYPEMMPNAEIKFARWVLSWNPDTGISPTVVRLVAADDGPSIFAELARQTRTNADSPFDDAIDITAALAPIWLQYQAKGAAFNIGHQTAGNGQNGPIIYGSWIEILFDLT